MATKRALHYIALGMAHRLAEEIDKDMGAGGGGGSAGCDSCVSPPLSDGNPGQSGSLTATW